MYLVFSHAVLLIPRNVTQTVVSVPVSIVGQWAESVLPTRRATLVPTLRPFTDIVTTRCRVPLLGFVQIAVTLL
ncbi:hypothetical protein [Streptomyces sioyaensis]|uniref:hypothetical protein n=1 Tax=Streptomyces sioyaensis TaxID=67364 RepID=UPI0037B67C3C